MEIGAVMEEARKAQKISRKELGKKIGVSDRTIDI